MSIGIYKITNKINNHAYIGQSVDIEKRWNKHINHDSADADYPLYRAFKKYGVDNFHFEIIETCNVDELNDREIYWIEYYDTFKNGYNQTMGGQGLKGCGSKLTIDQVEEISELLRQHNLFQYQIAAQYDVSEEVVQGINTGRYWHRNISYPIHDYTQDIKHNYCAKCGKEIGLKATLCVECSRIASRKTERPDKDTLFDEILNSSFSAVARKYGVSDNAVKKWCKSYGIPSSAAEYRAIKSKPKESAFSSKPRAVYQIDLNNNEIIAEYESTAAAARGVGVNDSSHIVAVCRGHRRSAYGYGWIYVD